MEKMTARFASVCPRCRGRIEAGTELERAEEGWCHRGCRVREASRKADRPSAPAAPKAAVNPEVASEVRRQLREAMSRLDLSGIDAALEVLIAPLRSRVERMETEIEALREEVRQV